MAKASPDLIVGIRCQSLSYLDNVYPARKIRHFNVVCAHVAIFATYSLVGAKEKVYGQLNEKQCDKVYDLGECGEKERGREKTPDPEECQIPTDPFNITC